MTDLNKILITQEKKSGFFARLYKRHRLVKMGIIQKQCKLIKNLFSIFMINKR